jgi:prepilin-type N-terminal cleavage/methylation domain-containing protein
MREQANCTPHLAHEAVVMNKITQRHGCSASRAGFTLPEVVTVLMLVGIMLGIAATQYSSYLRRTVPERAAGVVGSYVSLTRNFSVQRRASVTLALDPGTRTMMIRTQEDTIRFMSFGTNSDLVLTTLDSNFPGDSLVFNARGMCSPCGVEGKGITVTAGETYFITFTALGRWKSTRQ